VGQVAVPAPVAPADEELEADASALPGKLLLPMGILAVRALAALALPAQLGPVNVAMLILGQVLAMSHLAHMALGAVASKVEVEALPSKVLQTCSLAMAVPALVPPGTNFPLLPELAQDAFRLVLHVQGP
jgi:hypothetical protein